MRRILKSKRSFVIMLAAWLLLLWARTFTGIANGDCEVAVFGVLAVSVMALLGTCIGGYCLFALGDAYKLFYEEDKSREEISEWEDEEEAVMQSPGLRKSLLVVLVLAVFCLFSFASAEWNGNWDLFRDSTYMELGWWAFDVNKKYFFDVLVLAVFPVWSTFIIRKISESRCTAGAAASGIVQILALTIMGFLLYMRLSNIWLAEMALLNTLTLILAVRGYLWKNIQKKGNVVALLIGYVLFWVLLFSLFPCQEQTLAGFMGAQDAFDPSISGSYISNVNKILENASFVGQSPVLLRDPYVLEFMRGRNNPLLSALFYGGWCSVIVLLMIEILFVLAAAAVLIRNKRKDGRDVMLCMAWASLAIRVVAGTLYSFGVPVPILLPFTGSVGMIADSMSMGLLLVSCMVNKYREWFEISDAGMWEDWDEEDAYEEENV